jgi:hypothetical protein
LYNKNEKFRSFVDKELENYKINYASDWETRANFYYLR